MKYRCSNERSYQGVEKSLKRIGEFVSCVLRQQGPLSGMFSRLFKKVQAEKCIVILIIVLDKIWTNIKNSFS